MQVPPAHLMLRAQLRRSSWRPPPPTAGWPAVLRRQIEREHCPPPAACLPQLARCQTVGDTPALRCAAPRPAEGLHRYMGAGEALLHRCRGERLEGPPPRRRLPPASRFKLPPPPGGPPTHSPRAAMVGQSSGPPLPFPKLFTASAIAACTAEILTLPLGAPAGAGDGRQRAGHRVWSGVSTGAAALRQAAALRRTCALHTLQTRLKSSCSCSPRAPRPSTSEGRGRTGHCRVQ